MNWRKRIDKNESAETELSGRVLSGTDIREGHFKETSFAKEITICGFVIGTLNSVGLNGCGVNDYIDKIFTGIFDWQIK
ncbi:conserved hypothetical protein [Xenorhabdus nematophila F1]|nr:conserved hypothetical protein [Xenorhabdus nematophila F1]